MPLHKVLLKNLVLATNLLSLDVFAEPTEKTSSCFLLYEIGKGEIVRSPDEACKTRVSPASTFKIPHSLIALDSGAITNPQEKLLYDGTGGSLELWRKDHTLATAIKYSVVWYFQRIATRVGAEKEDAYLHKLAYGNMDSSSGLTTFWLGGSLLISPEEQQDFLVRLYEHQLPIKANVVSDVEQMLIQPKGFVVNALGEHPFNNPWPKNTVVSAKTGSATDKTGKGVRWLVGHVKKDKKSFIFVSCVIGDADLDGKSAIDLAAKSLRKNNIL